MNSHFEITMRNVKSTYAKCHIFFSNSYVKSTVNGDHLVIGHLAQKHVEEEKNQEQDKRPFLHQMED